MTRTILALTLALCSYAQAQVPFSQSDVRVFREGSSSVVLAAHADADKNFSIRVSAMDARSQSNPQFAVASLTIRAGANKLNLLKTCPAMDFEASGMSCQYTWLRSVMPATAEYTIRVTLKNGLWHEVYGKWMRPELTVQ